MRAVVQRVRYASVEVDGQIVGAIEHGLAVLLGVFNDDTEEDALWLADKICRFRVFADPHEKMNLSLLDVGYAMLVVSQFTLCADGKKGRRPSFDLAAPPQQAKALYEHFIHTVQSLGISVATGSFGAMMLVRIENDGPVTFVLDSP